MLINEHWYYAIGQAAQAGSGQANTDTSKAQKEASKRALELLRASQAVNNDLTGNGSAPLLSAREVCAVLGRSHASLYRDIAAGLIPAAVKIGSSSRWPASEIRALIERAKAARDAEAA